MGYSSAQLADLEAIRDAARRYARGVDRLDPDCMRSAYWPEATDDHGSFSGNAWEFVDHCMESHKRWRATMHCILNHLVELDDDGHARGEIYNVSYLFEGEATLHTWFGRYLDRYEKRGDEWRIIERVCVHEGTDSGPTAPMPIGWERFRSGSFDRPGDGRPVGP